MKKNWHCYIDWHESRKHNSWWTFAWSPCWDRDPSRRGCRWSVPAGPPCPLWTSRESQPTTTWLPNVKWCEVTEHSKNNACTWTQHVRIIIHWCYYHFNLWLHNNINVWNLKWSVIPSFNSTYWCSTMALARKCRRLGTSAAVHYVHTRHECSQEIFLALRHLIF